MTKEKEEKKRILRYYEKSHTYMVGRKKLKSATTFIGEFFDKFDAKAIARKLAKFPQNRLKKRGVRYWLNEWKLKAEYGTLVHKQIETFINGKKIIDMDPRTEKAIGWLAGCGMIPIETELIIHDVDLGIAGTIDCILEEPDTKEITLVDWKTNKNIKKKSYDGKFAKEPISHLEDHNFNKYSLQLSLYRYMLEQQGFKIKGCLLVHLIDGGDVKVYETPYLKEELEKMLASKLKEKN